MRVSLAKLHRSLGISSTTALLVGMIVAVAASSCAQGQAIGVHGSGGSGGADEYGGGPGDGGAGGVGNNGGSDVLSEAGDTEAESEAGDTESESEVGDTETEVGIEVGVCGDGVIDPGEDCDGTDLNGQTCSSLGAGDGTLACTSECTFTTSGCVMVGCPTTSLGTWNGSTIDQHGDGVCGASSRYNGLLCTGQPSEGSEEVFSITVPANKTINIFVKPIAHQVSVWVSTSCADYAAEACFAGIGNVSSADPAQTITITNVGTVSVTYYIVVDGKSVGDCRNFDIRVAPGVPVGCGNSVVEAGEECDGTNFAGKTCDFLGFEGGSLVCTSSCQIDTSNCLNSDVGEWTCADGAFGSGDGCDCGCGILDPDCADNTTASCDTCALDDSCADDCMDVDRSHNWRCGVPTYCGDGYIDPWEQCDGGNLGGVSCASEGFFAGTVSCVNCVIDTSNCYNEGPIDYLDGCDPQFCTWTSGNGTSTSYDTCVCTIPGAFHPVDNKISMGNSPCTAFQTGNGGADLIMRLNAAGYKRFSVSTCYGDTAANSSLAAFETDPRIGLTNMLGCNGDSQQTGTDSTLDGCSKINASVSTDATGGHFTPLGTTGEVWLLFDDYYPTTNSSRYWNNSSPRTFRIEFEKEGQLELPSYFVPCGAGEELLAYTWVGPRTISDCPSVTSLGYCNYFDYTSDAIFYVSHKGTVKKVATLVNATISFVESYSIQLMTPNNNNIYLKPTGSGSISYGSNADFTDTVYDYACSPTNAGSTIGHSLCVRPYGNTSVITNANGLWRIRVFNSDRWQYSSNRSFNNATLLLCVQP